MDLRPIQTVLVDTSQRAHGSALGFLSVPTTWVTDSFPLLYASTGLNRAGLFFETNTGNLILDPAPRWRDMGLSQIAASGTPPGVTGTTAPSFRESVDAATKKKQFIQYNSTKDVFWYAETAVNWLIANAAFHVKIGLAPIPKDATSQDAYNCYRAVIWPSDAKAGQNMLRVIFSLGRKPRLEWTQDGPTALNGQGNWQLVKEIEHGSDLLEARHFKNKEVTLTVLPLDGQLLIGLGSDLKRFDLSVPGYATKAGKLRFEGRNGWASFGFAQMMFVSQGMYDSASLAGPPHMATAYNNVKFSIQETVPAGTTVTPSIPKNKLDTVNYRFQYHLEMSGTDAGGADAGFAATTPLVKSVTVIWPPLYTPPPTPGYRALSSVVAVREVSKWDIQTGLRTKQFSIELENSKGQWYYQGGLTSVKVLLGYAHSGLVDRGAALAKTYNVWETTSDGAQSIYEFRADDLSWVLARNMLRDDLYPTGWCVYALARIVLQHGGIVPKFLEKIPECPYGPQTSCPHTKMPPHPGWKASNGTSVLSVLRELKEIVGAWMGQDEFGYMRFEPFNYYNPAAPKQVYTVGDQGPGPGGFANGAHKITRIRDMEAIRNNLLLIGFDQTTGQLLPFSYRGGLLQQSLSNPLYPGYLGFPATLYHESSVYSTAAFQQIVAANLAQWMAIPGEKVVVQAYGQPNIFPMDVIGVQEPRTVGPGSAYWVTDHVLEWDIRKENVFTSTIAGLYVNKGNIPGVAGANPN